MEQVITIKSYNKGLALNIKKDAQWETVLDTLSEKLKSSRQFFGNSKVALSVEGRTLSEQEEAMILDCFEMHTDLDIICLVGKDEEKQGLFDRLGYRYANMQEYVKEDFAEIHRGTVHSGESVESVHSIVILGDINPGAVVKTSGNLFVMGTVFGRVQTKGFIIAYDFSPEKLKINGFRYHSKNTTGFWSGLTKKIPKTAFVEGTEIIIKPATKELLETLLPG